MSSNVLAKAQDFSKGMSYMQASTHATWHRNFLSVGMASGSNSTVAMPPLEVTGCGWLCCPALSQSPGAGPKGRGASGEQLESAVLFAGWREEG